MSRLILSIIIFSSLLIHSGLRAQSNPATSSFAFNPLILSPSFAGLNTGTVTIVNDHQFTGLPGSGKTTISTFDYGLTDLNLGLALDITNDESGPTSQSIVRLSTAYHLKIGRSESFSFGMRHNFVNYKVDLLSENRIDNDDIVVADNTFSALTYTNDISGLYYSRKTYVGASILNAVSGRLFT